MENELAKQALQIAALQQQMDKIDALSSKLTAV